MRQSAYVCLATVPDDAWIIVVSRQDAIVGLAPHYCKHFTNSVSVRVCRNGIIPKLHPARNRRVSGLYGVDLTGTVRMASGEALAQSLQLPTCQINLGI